MDIHTIASAFDLLIWFIIFYAYLKLFTEIVGPAVLQYCMSNTNLTYAFYLGLFEGFSALYTVGIGAVAVVTYVNLKQYLSFKNALTGGEAPKAVVNFTKRYYIYRAIGVILSVLFWFLSSL